jgi:hypothetical protein
MPLARGRFRDIPQAKLIVAGSRETKRHVATSD